MYLKNASLQHIAVPKPSCVFTTDDIPAVSRRLALLHTTMHGASAHKSWHLELKRCFALLDELIRRTSADEAAAVLRLPEVRDCQGVIRQLRAYHEGMCEKAHAKRLLSSKHPVEEINRYMADTFPVTAVHSKAFKAAVEKRESCLLIGCGAVPSTAMLILRETGMSLHCIDKSPASCRLGRRIVETAECRRAGFEAADVMDINDFTGWDVIFVTVLAGVDPRACALTGRRALIGHLLRRAVPGTLLALRTAYGLARLIYPSVDPELTSARKCVEIGSPAPGRSSLLLVEV